MNTKTITRNLLLDSLDHDDPFVRNPVLAMLAGDGDTGADATRSAIAAIRKFGWEAAFEYPHQLAELPIDAEAFSWAMEEIARAGEGAANDNTKLHLLRWLAEAPVEILEPRLDEFADSPIAHREREIFRNDWATDSVNRGRKRVELSKLSAGESLALMDGTLSKCGDTKEFPHRHVDLLKLICERLADADELADRAMDWLKFDFDQPNQIGHWRAGVAIELAGRLKLEIATPRLLEMFDYDWDWWNERIQKALRRIGSLGMLQVVIDGYPAMEWHARLFLSGVFERVRSPEMEARVAVLLKVEEDGDLRAQLGWTTARYGTESSMNLAKSIYLEDPDDGERTAIAEILYAFWTIAGKADPLLSQWRGEFEERLARRRTSLLDRFAKVPPSKATAKADPKIGRNDPCPCGSGRKYKKCCLAKAN